MNTEINETEFNNDKPYILISKKSALNKDLIEQVNNMKLSLSKIYGDDIEDIQIKIIEPKKQPEHYKEIGFKSKHNNRAYKNHRKNNKNRKTHRK